MTLPTVSWIAMLAIVGACGGGSKADPVEPQSTTEPAEAARAMPITGSCSRADTLRLYRTRAPSHTPFSEEFTEAEATAHTEAAKGQQAYDDKDDALAASHFLSCVQAYARVPATDGVRDHATKNAELCLANAVIAYSNAETFESVGRAKLEAAAKADPSLEAKIRGYLEKPPAGCRSTQRR